MTLTPAQLRGLQNIAKWCDFYGRPFHKESASKTTLAVRQNILEYLEKAGLIESSRPFAGGYHRVTITESGRGILNGGDDA